MKKSLGHTSGFTIVELITVIAIIGILSSVVIASVSQARANSRDKVRKVDVEQLQLTFRLYREMNPTYPDVSGATAIAAVTGLSAFGPIPSDPLNGASYGYYYDDAYSCGGTAQTVVYANTMESSGSANEDAVCGTSGSSKYIVILK